MLMLLFYRRKILVFAPPPGSHGWYRPWSWIHLEVKIAAAHRGFGNKRLKLSSSVKPVKIIHAITT